jgi:hypothetical protein
MYRALGRFAQRWQGNLQYGWPMRRPILGGGAMTVLARNALEPDWNR